MSQASKGNDHIVWQNTRIARADRERLNGHPGLCIWLTGLSGAGKSTLAVRLEERLHSQGVRTYLLDGDNVRHGLSADLGFSEDDRREQIRRVAEVAKLFVDAGVVVIAALISPFEADRKHARSLFDEGAFIEVFVDCPVEVCAERDPKGLYEKAKQGLIPQFTGISSPYERPKTPDVTVNTAAQSVEDGVLAVLDAVDSRTAAWAKRWRVAR
ncbi:MAG: adenylyl-sulfate kinase [Alicyclobacillus sp.]|nr:adenylyl-sulfate kinase [Alicyclobacillus sp.]